MSDALTVAAALLCLGIGVTVLAIARILGRMRSRATPTGHAMVFRAGRFEARRRITDSDMRRIMEPPR